MIAEFLCGLYLVLGLSGKMWIPASAGVVHRSSITKWATRISWERFGLESPDFKRISTPNDSTAMSDMTTLDTSSRKLSQKNCRKCRFRWLQVEFLEKGLSEDQEQICQIWQYQLLPVGCKMQLDTAQKCVRWVRPAKASNNSATV